MAKSPETKLSKVLRQLLSFVLFVMMVLLVFSSTIRAIALDKIRIENAFTSNAYIAGLRENIIDYAEDTYIRNGLDTDNLNDVFEYSLIKESVKAYIACNIHSSVGYDENTYNEAVRSVTALYTDDLKDKIKTDKTVISDLSASFEAYYKNEIELGAMGYIEKVINVGSIASLAICIVSAFFAVSSALILFFIGNKRYRNVRAIGNSMMSAGIFNILFSFMSIIILNIKHIDIYPLYLSDIFMSHFNVFVSSIMSIGGIMIVFAIIIYTIVWKMKKG